jgi:hypothetical protein
MAFSAKALTGALIVPVGVLFIAASCLWMAAIRILDRCE